MTKLTKAVQSCGLCCGECKSITYKEATAAIKVMREAFIEAINTMDLNGINIVNNDAMTGIKLSIRAIKSVK